MIEKLSAAKVGRIVLSEPPEIPAAADLPAWSALLAADTPVFVPERHRFAQVSGKSGVVQLTVDSDGVLRRSSLWHLNGGAMSPSLPLAIALRQSATATAPRMSGMDDAVYFSSYAKIPRIEVSDLLGQADDDALRGATVFVDADREMVGSVEVIPSGQFVTHSEITAALLADIENDRMIIAPSWVHAMEYLLPGPPRNRRDPVHAGSQPQGNPVLTVAGVLGIGAVRGAAADRACIRASISGRPILMFVGVGALSAYLVADVKKASVDAFKKGSDFLLGRTSRTSLCRISALQPVGDGCGCHVQTISRVRATGQTRAR